MAGTTSGLAPTAPAAGRTIPLPTTTRVKMLHGVWALGPVVAAVLRNRKLDEQQRPVILTLHDGALQLQALLTPVLARELAHALIVAAEGGAV